jgi:hypothetical protein
MSKVDCQCDNEAKVIYDMLVTLGKNVEEHPGVQDGEYQTETCCHEGLSKVVISGKTLTIYYPDDTISTYTAP